MLFGGRNKETARQLSTPHVKTRNQGLVTVSKIQPILRFIVDPQCIKRIYQILHFICEYSCNSSDSLDDSFELVGSFSYGRTNDDLVLVFVIHSQCQRNISTFPQIAR